MQGGREEKGRGMNYVKPGSAYYFLKVLMGLRAINYGFFSFGRAVNQLLTPIN